MSVRLLVTLLLGTALIFAAPARADRIRTGSSYGQTSQIASSSLATQWGVCLPDDPGDCDLLVQINGMADMDQPVQITLNNTLLPGTIGFLNGEDNNPSTTFGLIDCVMSVGTNLGNTTGTPCFSFGSSTPPTQDLGCNLSSITDIGGTFTIPAGACLDATDTFYFDVTGATVNPATIGPVTSGPEPSSLALFGIGLISVALLSRRRLQA